MTIEPLRPCTQRRVLMRRDPPYDFIAAMREIRERTGLGTSDLEFILNIHRSTLWSIEVRGSRPNVDDGDAIRKYLKECRISVT